MGSKRLMLANDLGGILDRECQEASRFFDLFAGSAAVATYVATHACCQVVAADLQSYSCVLADAVLLRDFSLPPEPLWNKWYTRAVRKYRRFDIPVLQGGIERRVLRAREWSATTGLPITGAYGGHYFSPVQSVWIDCLRSSLPRDAVDRSVALAALICAASKCAAAPGHTAQPFQPTETAGRFLEEAWARNILIEVRRFLASICHMHALVPGFSVQGDAAEVLLAAREGDIAFVDPPYSSVHYSRFYHVLETIAQGGCGDVQGVGRYPDQALRPRSRYSIKSESREAVAELFDVAASRGVRLIVTFPDYECSNGLSGDFLQDLAARRFRIDSHRVVSRFSTLGGTSGASEGSGARAARVSANELILVLRPK